MKRLSVLIMLVLSMAHFCLSDTVYSTDMETKAKKGDAFAQAQLGYCYWKGSGIEKNNQKACEWFNKSAAQGNAYSMFGLGRLFTEGNASADDLYKGVQWFEKSYEKGYEKSKEYLDKFALPEQRYDYHIINLADNGDSDAQYELAIWLWPAVSKDGVNGKRINDEKRAFQWMQTAADAGEIRAVRDLGSMYIEGIAGVKDPQLGVNYYKKAAEAGDKKAQYSLGLCFANGIGVEKDEVEAVSWINRSANKGYSVAMFELGWLYHHGDLGLSKDMVKAIDWYKKAAKAGSSNALANLGYCYQNGIGVEKDFWKAIDYYGQSAQLGNGTVQKIFEALSYQIAKKTPKYIKKLKSDAQKGDAESQGKLGGLYLSNLPRQYNIDRLDPIKEGAKWILEAAKNGYDEVYYLAGMINETGSISEIVHTSTYQVDLSSSVHSIQPIDLNSARVYYEKCAASDASNNWLGQLRLAKAFYNGEELAGTVDYAKSVNYIRSVIDFLEERAPVCQELRDAYDIMSKCYYHGRGVEIDQQKADEYLKKSARLGNTRPFEQNVLNSFSYE